MSESPKRLRCAIYTRKSTEEGLEQAFNTLDAQREACEAYILSQTGEGWECIPDHYDDGGWSGGNMDRPALKQLLDDIGHGKIDVVVVYKVDRLTRSLMDFARIVETFDTHQVSFVSVTQAFNTTSSMGRLTLNVLLSFAQFEREVTGERIRDKIAASKARGMWMGGVIPLGYDLGDRLLLVNETEARLVRQIFTRYLELGSIPKLANALARDGIATKRWTSRSGREHGGVRFSCGAIAHILSNRLYLGEIVHRGKSHAGNHQAIVSRKLFAKVQDHLAGNRQARVRRKTRAATCPLTGRIFDEDGQPMRPSFSYGRGKRTYRYYVSETLLPNGGIGHTGNMAGRRISASRLERILVDRLARLVPQAGQGADPFPCIRKVVCSEREIRLVLDLALLRGDGLDDAMLLGRAQHHLDASARIDGNALLLTIEAAGVRLGRSIRPARELLDQAEQGSVLAELLCAAHRMLARHNASPLEPDQHAAMTAPVNAWGRDRVGVALLAPDIQKALLLGTAPAGVEPDGLLGRDLPLDWDEQRRVLGFGG